MFQSFIISRVMGQCMGGCGLVAADVGGGAPEPPAVEAVGGHFPEDAFPGGGGVSEGGEELGFQFLLAETVPPVLAGLEVL